MMPINKQTLALIGANGMLAQAVTSAARHDYVVVPLDLPEFDMTDSALVDRVLGQIDPDVIVNCAAYTNVDGCESAEALATRVNGEGPGTLARVAQALDATLVHLSTDYVFDGSKTTPYTEEDIPGPQSAYGRSKLAGERAILGSGLEKFFIVRTSWLYGPGGKNFVETILHLAAQRDELRIIADQVGTPTFTDDLADAIFRLLNVTRHSSPVTAPKPYGIYHFSNQGQCSWYEFAAEIVTQARKQGVPVKAQRVVPITTAEYPLPARRPAYSVFSKDKYQRVTGAQVPDWQASLVTYMSCRSK